MRQPEHPALGEQGEGDEGGDQAVEDAVVLAHHGGDPAAYPAAPLPRTTAIARRAVRAARLNTAGSRTAGAVRDTAVATLSRAAPALPLRGFDGIAGRQPPYASGRESAGNR
ncbi:hypothetical protein [Streptomyces bungoensis]|uniref:hypothetical protein n=1 Tax=Streptomyces bungoensis TaxID=285568 RepID=UPI00131BDABE